MQFYLIDARISLYKNHINQKCVTDLIIYIEEICTIGLIKAMLF